MYLKKSISQYNVAGILESYNKTFYDVKNEYGSYDSNLSNLQSRIIVLTTKTLTWSSKYVFNNIFTNPYKIK